MVLGPTLINRKFLHPHFTRNRIIFLRSFSEAQNEEKLKRTRLVYQAPRFHSIQAMFASGWVNAMVRNDFIS